MISSLTVKCQTDKLERGVAQANIQASGRTAGPNPRQVKHL